jgi:hypothetical protein
LRGINDGDLVSLFSLMMFSLTLTGLTGFIALSGNDDDYVERVVSSSELEKNAQIFRKSDSNIVSYSPSMEIEAKKQPTTIESSKDTIQLAEQYKSSIYDQSSFSTPKPEFKPSQEQLFAESLKAMTAGSNIEKVALATIPIGNNPAKLDKSPSVTSYLSSLDGTSSDIMPRRTSSSVDDSIRTQSAESLATSELSGSLVESPPVSSYLRRSPSTSDANRSLDSKSIPLHSTGSVSSTSIPSSSTKYLTGINKIVENSGRSPSRTSQSYLDSISNSKVNDMGPAYDTSRWSPELVELWNGRYAQVKSIQIRITFDYQILPLFPIFLRWRLPSFLHKKLCREKVYGKE